VWVWGWGWRGGNQAPLWESLGQKMLRDISVQLHATPLLFFSASGALWVTRLRTNRWPRPLVTHPRCLVGGSDGHLVFWDVSMCVQRRWVLKGGGVLLSQGKFQVANSWHACAAGSVTKGPRTPPHPRPPPPPSPGNPINCVRQRELVSIDTHSAAVFDWQTKDTATWRLTPPGGRAARGRAGPVPGSSREPWLDPRSASALMKRERGHFKGFVRRFP